jgi:hypothetical protein
MNKIELKNYPLSAKLVKEWFMKEMIESFKDETVPTEFKDFMLEQGIEDDKVETLINLNPRSLFDFFDENKIYIEIILYPDGEFTCKIGNQSTTISWKKRKKAEFSAIENAFIILEEKLTPLEFTNLKEE